MSISFDLPADIEQRLREKVGDVASAAREAFLVDLYRREILTHYQLSQALGLSRYETDGVLKRHGVMLEITREQVASEIASFRPAASR